MSSCFVFCRLFASPCFVDPRLRFCCFPLLLRFRPFRVFVHARSSLRFCRMCVLIFVAVASFLIACVVCSACPFASRCCFVFALLFPFRAFVFAARFCFVLRICRPRSVRRLVLRFLRFCEFASFPSVFVPVVVFTLLRFALFASSSPFASSSCFVSVCLRVFVVVTSLFVLRPFVFVSLRRFRSAFAFVRLRSVVVIRCCFCSVLFARFVFVLRPSVPFHIRFCSVLAFVLRLCFCALRFCLHIRFCVSRLLSVRPVPFVRRLCVSVSVLFCSCPFVFVVVRFAFVSVRFVLRCRRSVPLRFRFRFVRFFVFDLSLRFASSVVVVRSSCLPLCFPRVVLSLSRFALVLRFVSRSVPLLRLRSVSLRRSAFV